MSNDVKSDDFQYSKMVSTKKKSILENGHETYINSIWENAKWMTNGSITVITFMLQLGRASTLWPYIYPTFLGSIKSNQNYGTW